MGARAEGPLRTDPADELRPESFALEDVMAANGRPRAADSAARRAEFLRLLLAGTDCGQAIKAARIKPERAAAILAEIARPLLSKAA